MTGVRAPGNIVDPAFELAESLSLAADEVHLWRIDLNAVAANERRWMSILSPDEQQRAQRFHFERDRQFFAATRALLRTLLAGYRNTQPRDLTFRYSAREKPSLAPPHAGEIEFNVSHSGGAALLAFTRDRAIGVDIEKITDQRDRETIARRFFSEHEQRVLGALPVSERTEAFFRCWTRKESYIKAVGDGLSLPLDQFDVSLEVGDQNALVATRPDAGEAARWSLREVSAGEGYAGAICVRGAGWLLRSWDSAR